MKSLFPNSAFPAFLLCCALLAPFRGNAQATPAGYAPDQNIGFQLPKIGGSLRYSLTASESLIFGYNGQPGTGVNSYTNFSGNLAYLSKSVRAPFSAVYAGGYLVGTSSQPSYPFHNLALSQVFQTKSWDFALADSVNYLPQTPDVGLSGIPGVGDVGLPPVQIIPGAGLGILTNFSTRVSNTASGTATYKFTAATSAFGSGTYLIQRFVGSNSVGLDSNQLSISGGVHHRLDARNGIGANYSYSNTSFLNYGGAYGGTTRPSFNSQAVSVEYNRLLTRLFTLDVSAGPQRVGGGTLLSASSTNLTAQASLAYTGHVYTSALGYYRGATTGNGVTIGSNSDSLNLNTQRRLGPVWNISGLIGYNHSKSFPNSLLPPFSTSGVVFSGQAARKLGNLFSFYSSYTIQRQSFSGTAPGLNAFNGLSQVIGVGITYAPPALFGRR